MNAAKIMIRAQDNQQIIPAFNVPYLPMVKPVMEAIIDEDTVGMIQVARVDWTKLFAVSMQSVVEEFARYDNGKNTLLHLDHTPVIDEDLNTVDYLPIMKEAIQSGFHSVMLDASRLSFEDNIRATAEIAQMAHEAGVACEAELGSVFGHESNLNLSYEEIFAKKLGFTKIDEAQRFAKESGCDWLSVAVGSIHGSLADNMRNQKKPRASLDVEHIKALKEAVGIPLVLHGGSGIDREVLHQGIKSGIAKINIGTEIRHTYEHAMAEKNDVAYAQQCLYEKTRDIIKVFLNCSGTQALLNGTEMK